MVWVQWPLGTVVIRSGEGTGVIGYSGHQEWCGYSGHWVQWSSGVVRVQWSLGTVVIRSGKGTVVIGYSGHQEW